MKREVAWEWVQGAGLEHCAIVSSPGGVEMTGVVVADWEGRTLAVHYHLQCDAGWRLVRALVRAGHGGERSERAIEQASPGLWRIDGADARAGGLRGHRSDGDALDQHPARQASAACSWSAPGIRCRMGALAGSSRPESTTAVHEAGHGRGGCMAGAVPQRRLRVHRRPGAR